MITTDRFDAKPGITVPACLRTGRWEDHSYGNDSVAKAIWPLCDCATHACGVRRQLQLTTCEEQHARLMVFVAQEDREDREESSWPRFMLWGVQLGMEEADGNVLWEGESEEQLQLEITKALA